MILQYKNIQFGVLWLQLLHSQDSKKLAASRKIQIGINNPTLNTVNRIPHFHYIVALLWVVILQQREQTLDAVLIWNISYG